MDVVEIFRKDHRIAVYLHIENAVRPDWGFLGNYIPEKVNPE